MCLQKPRIFLQLSAKIHLLFQQQEGKCCLPDFRSVCSSWLLSSKKGAESLQQKPEPPAMGTQRPQDRVTYSIASSRASHIWSIPNTEHPTSRASHHPEHPKYKAPITQSIPHPEHPISGASHIRSTHHPEHPTPRASLCKQHQAGAAPHSLQDLTCSPQPLRLSESDAGGGIFPANKVDSCFPRHIFSQKLGREGQQSFP